MLAKKEDGRKDDNDSDNDNDDFLQCAPFTISEAETISGAYSKFKTTLVRHTVHRPPFSIALFTFEEARAISSFISENLFSRFDLLRYCYCPNAILDLTINLNISDQEPKEDCKPFAEEKTAQVIFRQGYIYKIDA